MKCFLLVIFIVLFFDSYSQEWVSFIGNQEEPVSGNVKIQKSENNSLYGYISNLNGQLTIKDSVINENGSFIFKMSNDGQIKSISPVLNFEAYLYKYYNHKHYFAISSNDVLHNNRIVIKGDTLISNYSDTSYIYSTFLISLDTNFNLLSHYEFRGDSQICNEFNICNLRITKLDAHDDDVYVLFDGDGDDFNDGGSIRFDNSTIGGDDYILKFSDSLTEISNFATVNNDNHNFNFNSINTTFYYQVFNQLKTINPLQNLNVGGKMIKVNGLNDGCFTLENTILKKYDNGLIEGGNWNIKGDQLFSSAQSTNGTLVMARPKISWNFYNYSQIMKIVGDSIYTYDLGKAINTPIQGEKVVETRIYDVFTMSDSFICFSGEILAYKDVSLVNENITGDQIKRQFIASLPIQNVNETLYIEDNILDENKVLIFPNPVCENFIFIKNLSKQKFNSVSLYNAVGKKLQTNIYENGENETTIDISNISKGMFFLKIENQENSLYKKIIRK